MRDLKTSSLDDVVNAINTQSSTLVQTMRELTNTMYQLINGDIKVNLENINKKLDEGVSIEIDDTKILDKIDEEIKAIQKITG